MLSIVIVNWNAGTLLLDAISSIAKHHHNLVTSVIIVDNASTDDSLIQVELLQDLPFQLQVIRNTTNRGFGAACNQGAALATSEYLLFLNPDTRLFENSLIAPLNFMQDNKNQNIGIVGIQLIDEEGKVARDCARFPTSLMFFMKVTGLSRLSWFKSLDIYMSEWEHSNSRRVDQVIGAFFFMRGTLFKALGGFDERFFVYFEEVDLSLRAYQAGYRSFYLAEVQAFHARGGASRNVKVKRLFYSLRSRLLYGFKHFTLLQAYFLLLVTVLIEPISRSLLALLQGRMHDVGNTWKGFALLYCELPKIIRDSCLKSVKK